MAALTGEQVRRMHAYWRAANYLSVGQIYLKDNPLLERPLTLDDIKPRLLGHWGTTSGLNFIYTHLNRVINERDLNMMYIIGPGHGGPGIVAHTYLEGSYTEVYPHIERNRDGIKRLFRQFSWPYGIPSHVAPETPGSIHEGESWGIRCCTRMGRLMTIRIWWWLASLAMARRRPGRALRAGMPTSFWTRRKMGRCCRFCT